MNGAYWCILIGGTALTLWSVWRGWEAYKRTMGRVVGATRWGGPGGDQ